MKNWDEKLQRLLEREKVAGMSVAVTDREKIIYSKGFGAESVERPEVAPNGLSMYRIASISKLVTGITLLRLVEEGKLALDRPVRDYVPWLTLTSKEALAQMTLRHLMSHTAGLPTEYTPDGPREESALEGFLRDNLPNLEFATLPSEGVHHYSNWGIHLASYMAERVTGKRFTELCREYALAPLGMDRTTYDLRVAATYPVSVPHIAGEDGVYVSADAALQGDRIVLSSPAVPHPVTVDVVAGVPVFLPHGRKMLQRLGLRADPPDLSQKPGLLLHVLRFAVSVRRGIAFIPHHAPQTL